jgi:hypothetical protein
MLALTSPTSGGRSVGLVRLRTKATQFLILLFFYNIFIFIGVFFLFVYKRRKTNDFEINVSKHSPNKSSLLPTNCLLFLFANYDVERFIYFRSGKNGNKTRTVYSIYFKASPDKII